ncbi:hypothetical protein Xmau_03543 [Xenorhabdus mauleonii]|uniref:Uncharacterized protein n=1 Tax=Xenorhabdus mauleonii TaxID=351675 RepID=A0A1I3WTX4_9GAMM|nr:hypothetical protein [Xenorhabdus mauleonii]PHM38158.1 hypothetical protein Xmau_03543 [Xenorhabdus mauleonii]SFK10800.1 hypothetical protein SAMN05421680_12929 [Xenorhabdus mauleonii]
MMNDKIYLPPGIFQDEKQNIHFDTLMEQARTILKEQSGDLWTDTTAHDPGITLLEALAYNVSDLSYRHLLPLVDLLTPASVNKEKKKPLFPAGFQPERMLTTSPITAEDYRKGILDITIKGDDGEIVYAFCDAKMEKNDKENSYLYFYNKKNRELTFFKENDSDPALYLNGSYTVKVKPSLYSKFHKSKYEQLKELLEDYLKKNTNICEVIGEVNWLCTDDTHDFNLYMDVSISDIVSDINEVFLAIFITAQNTLSPEYERVPTMDFQHQNYTGPLPQQGWLIDVPQENKVNCFTIYTSQIQQAIESLPFVNHVSYINFGEDRNKVIFSANGANSAFWLDDNNIVSTIAKMLKCVTVTYKGQVLTGDADEISRLLREKMQREHQISTEPYPIGHYRNPSRYYPASDLLPSLYNLQEYAPEHLTLQLHQFLLPFEQLLANGCAQLAYLPKLLDFSATIEEPIWGHQWPFAEKSINNQVHNKYKEKVEEANWSNQQNIIQQIALTNYLQSYFGLPKNENIGLATDEEFLQVQRAYLSSLPQTGYSRTATNIHQISSLQRRVAARLGIGVMLFDDMPEADRLAYLEHLPFYIVEHPLLMPKKPETDFIDAKPVTSVQYLSEPRRLLITVQDTLAGKLKAGQLVDLFLKGNETLKAILVAAVNNNTFTLYIDEHVQLRRRWSKVLEIAQAGNLKWCTSNSWLKDMEYRVILSSNQEVLSDGQTRIETSADQPWPPILLPDDTVTIKQIFTGQITTRESDLEARVDSVDHIHGQAVITILSKDKKFDPKARYQWHISKGKTQAMDRFSFTLSFVFKRSLMMNGQTSSILLAEREAYIKRIIQEEIPAHLLARVLWLSDQQFSVFSSTYARWLNNTAQLGSDTYRLLKMLSIGMLPGETTGIGVMHIITDEELHKLPSNTTERQQYIDDLGLFFVPDIHEPTR